MRKYIYIAILSIVTAITATSCTEQEVKPRDGGPAGTGIDPKG